MSIEGKNKAVIVKLLEQTDRGNLNVIDEFYSPHYKEHNPKSAKRMAEGIEGVRKAFQVFSSAFPDASHKIEDIIAEGDKVAARITFTGTFKNALLGYPPTGNQIKAMGTAFYRIEDGKIVEKWEEFSALDLLGIAPIAQKDA